tara:strand:+ start:418 stop:735 length:318 start_codon:yes stop_codon:yes gene_type:complete
VAVNKNAWQTRETFQKFMEFINEKVIQQNRNIIILLDNATSHFTPENPLNLSNITFLYLPPNTTSRIQPLDALLNQAYGLYLKKNILIQVDIPLSHFCKYPGPTT